VDEFNLDRVKNNISAKTIIPNEKANRRWTDNPEKYLLNFKLAPKALYDSSVSIEIYKGFVQIVSYRYLQGIVIENQDVAEVLAQIFKMNWQALERGCLLKKKK
jgi:hypothetical protein